MKALNSFIVVLPMELERKESSTGLLLSGMETAKQRYQQAEVILASEDLPYDADGNPVIRPGDIVAYDSVQGHDYRMDEKNYRIIMYRDVALIL
jgi:co-chaperonin GroES (HSP10)